MEPLHEVSLLRKFLRGLGDGGDDRKKKKETDDNELSPEAFERQVKKIILSIIRSARGKRGRTGKKRGATGTMLVYHISVSGKKYLLKTYMIPSSGYVYMTLWDDTEQDLLSVITLGYLPDDEDEIVAKGKQRLAMAV